MRIILLFILVSCNVLYSQSFTITRQPQQSRNIFLGLESRPKLNLVLQDSVFFKIYTVVDKIEASALLVEYKLPDYSISFGPNLLLWYKREKLSFGKSSIGFEVKFTLRFK